MEKNSSGKRNTAMAKVSMSATIQKITASVLLTHQAVDGSFIHQARDTEKISRVRGKVIQKTVRIKNKKSYVQLVIE